MREQGGVADDSGVALNPDRGAKARRGVAQPTLQGNLLEAVVASANMHAAWARVKSNKGAPIGACEFLGFRFRQGKLRWSDAAFADFMQRVRELTGRSWGVSMRYRFDKLAQYVRG